MIIESVGENQSEGLLFLGEKKGKKKHLGRNSEEMTLYKIKRGVFKEY